MAKVTRDIGKASAPQSLNIPRRTDTTTAEGIQAPADANLAKSVQGLMAAQKSLRALDAEKFRLTNVNSMRDIIRGMENEESQLKGSAADGSTDRGRLAYEKAIGELSADADIDHKEALIASLNSLADSSLNKLAVYERGQKDVEIAAQTEKFITDSHNRALGSPGLYEQEKAEIKDYFDPMRATKGDEIVDVLITEANQQVLRGALEGDIRNKVTIALARDEDLKAVKKSMGKRWGDEWTEAEKAAAEKFADTEYAHQKKLDAQAQTETYNEVVSEVLGSEDQLEAARKAQNLPIVKGNVKLLKDLQSIEANAVKSINKAQKDFELDTAIDIYLDPDNETPATELAKDISDMADAKSFMAYTEKLSTVPKARQAEVNSIITNFKADAKNTEVFGEPGSLEAEAEKMRQIRAFNQWITLNPDGDVIEYYERVMEKNEPGAFGLWLSRASFGIIPSGDGAASPAIVRAEVEAENLQKKTLRGERVKKRSWVERQKRTNPTWTEEQLGREYDVRFAQ